MKLSDEDIRIHEKAKEIDPIFGRFPITDQIKDLDTLIVAVVDYVLKEAPGIERVRDEAGRQTILYLRDDGPR